MKHILTAAVAVLGMAAGAQAATLAERYSSFWAIGDSLTDDGNMSRAVYALAVGPRSNTQHINAYYQDTSNFWSYEGRFTNGKTWAEHVAAGFAAEGLVTGNFAYGGARATPDGIADFIDPAPEIQWQRDQVIGRKASFGATPLVSILAGANDIFDTIGSTGLLSTAKAAAIAVADAARALVPNGVQDFLIGRLPDIGKTPAYTLVEPNRQADATAASAAFNAQIDLEIAALRAQGLRVQTLDLWQIMGDIIGNPASIGLSNVTKPCYYPTTALATSQGDTRMCSVAESKTRLFFDSVHPNYVAHADVGARVLAALKADAPQPAPVPLPAGAPLLLGGIALFALVRRRAQG